MSATDPAALAEPLGSMVRYAMWKGRRDGRTVTLVSGRRSIAQQIELRKAHCGTSDYAINRMPSSKCRPPTAPPGKSKHQTGEAADLGGDKEYAYRLLSPFGAARPVRGEDWHFEWKGSDFQSTMKKIAASMKSQNATEADFDVVFLSNSKAAQDQSSGLTGDFLRGLGIVDKSTGGVGGAVVGGVRSIDDLVTVLGSPGLWRRLGIGAAGIALLTVGLVLIARDRIPTPTIAVGG